MKIMRHPAWPLRTSTARYYESFPGAESLVQESLQEVAGSNLIWAIKASGYQPQKANYEITKTTASERRL